MRKDEAELRGKGLVAGLIFLLSISLMGCLATTTTGRKGEMIGAGIGGGTGAIFNRENPWRGAMIWGTLFGLFGGLIGDAIEKQEQQRLSQGLPPPAGYQVKIPRYFDQQRGVWVESHWAWIPREEYERWLASQR